LARPILGVPVGSPRRCYALALYGGHEAGTDLDSPSATLLGSLARDAEIAHARIESQMLQKQVIVLQSQLAQTSAHCCPGPPRPLTVSWAEPGFVKAPC
jgi:hypothetical protein